MKEKIQGLFLKLTFIVAGLITILVAVFLFPGMATEIVFMAPDQEFLSVLFLVLMYPTAAAFLFALFQALRLMGYIDRGQVFSPSSVKALRLMKIAGTIMTILLYIGFMPACFLTAEYEDAPGLVIMAFLFSSIPLVVATFVAILQRLLQEAVAIKDENEFTV